MHDSQTNRLLGYPPDARLLIINADDFGMCHSVNDAVIRAFQHGVLCSTTLMVPCPWALHAMHYLADHPEIPFGVHLTVISDWVDYRWGPLTQRTHVPSLVEGSGYFHNFEGMPKLLAHVNFDELKLEFRAQIEAVLNFGLHPTHLDWHSLRISEREDIPQLMFDLAREYDLAFRVAGDAWTQKVQSQGLPTNDRHFMDSYHIDPANKASIYAHMLQNLPAGLNEWAVHPGLDGPELLAIERENNHIRQSDFDFLTSHEAKQIINEEGIILLDYRPLQQVWRAT